jgi:RHS repeat-associated protein
LLFLIGSASAQYLTTSATDGQTPLALQPGAPAGSYALSDFDSINYYNGNLNFHLPILGVGGRGAAQMTMMLAIDSKGWHVKHHEQAVPQVDCGNGTGIRCGDESNYATTNLPEPGRWSPSAGYGVGMLFGRSTGVGQNTCNQQGNPSYGSTLTRLTFINADGTEYELRDQLYAGQPQPVTGGVCNGGRVAVSRGTVFTSADGNAATFISDQAIIDKAYAGAEGTERIYPSGYLMLKDGTRYRINGGKVAWMRDRNGNLISFSYDDADRVTTITDSLERRVTVEYNVTEAAPYGVCDRITYRGFGGAQRVVRVSSTSLSNVLRAGFTLSSYHDLFPRLNGSDNTIWNPTRVSAVWMPDGRSYRLYYNNYGELARVELPTGGAIQYDYTSTNESCLDDLGSNCTDQNAIAVEIYRRVLTKKVYREANTLDSTTTISVPVTTSSGGGVPESVVTVDHLNASGARMVREKHYYYGDPVASLFNGPTSYPGWKQSREFKTETHDAASTHASPKLLRSVENTWAQRTPLPSWIANQASDLQPEFDVRLTQAETTLWDTGTSPRKVAKRTYDFDQYNNETDVYEYNYGDGEAGAFVRRTHTDYLTTNTIGGTVFDYDTDTTIHLRSLPSQQWMSSDAAGTQKKAITSYEYDNYTADATHAPLVARAGISGLDASFTTGKKTRGNVTSLSHRLIQDDRDVKTYQQYDVAGNVIKSLDAELNPTTFTFTDNFGTPNNNEARAHTQPTYWLGAEHTFAFATQIKNALNQITYLQYDYYIGKAINVEDVNTTVYSGYYADALDRPTQLVSAYADAVSRHQTKFTYDDTNRTITTTSDKTNYNDNLLKNQVVYDGLGRPIKSLAYEDATRYILVEQQFDALGRVSRKTNPYRPTATPAESAQWATTIYDELGRVISVTTPDNAQVLTTYSGNTKTVRDQANKDRRITTDALGRLTQVVEDPGTGGLNYLTTYSYDVLDDLLTVEQGSQIRTFQYDSLKRLTQATTPESGTLKFEYDDNGSLVKKVDSRKVTTTPLVYLETTLAYDALNRVTTKSYNDGTPTVNYTYDNAALPSGGPTATEFARGASIGRLVAVTYGSGGTGSYYGYDALGRVNQSLQKTETQKYSMPAYTYDRAGHLLAQQYPSGRVVKTTYDGAGRISTLTGTKDGVTKTYASQFAYASHGAISRMKLGNGLWEHTAFNTRLQPTEIGLGLSYQDSSQLKLTYDYGAASVNNGNLLSQTLRVEAISGVRPLLNLKQTYTYDELNRLETASEINLASGNAPTWKQAFQYDQFGNRTINATQTTSVMVGMNPSISSANNRISKAGYAFDPAGNMTLDEMSHTYQYDAENRMVGFDGGVGATYTYDGEGRRVKKVIGTGSLTVTTIYVYDAIGKLVAEYATNTSGSDSGTRYLTVDNLGNTRVVTDGVKVVTTQTAANGAIKARYDYAPFGEEVASNFGGRSAIPGYTTSDTTHQKFTSKERDAESGLDYFGARYYGHAQGRFTSCDPITVSKKQLVNPQRWNLYAYVINNPLSLYDPDGLSDQGSGGAKVIDVFLAYEGSNKDEVRQDINRRLSEMGYSGPAPQINIYNWKESTVDNVLKSLGTPGRTTIIVGHAWSLDVSITKKENGGNDPGDVFPGEAIKLYDGYIGIEGVLHADGSRTPLPSINAENLFFFGCRLTPRSVGSFISKMTRVGASFVYNDGGTDGLSQLGTAISLAGLAAASTAAGNTGGETQDILQNYVNKTNSQGGPVKGWGDKIRRETPWKLDPPRRPLKPKE